MKRYLLPLAAVAAVLLSATATARQANDPVVMTINGKDVKQSEFKYLYNKNNLQQATPQTIDEYVDMFVVYKLKVAAAEAAGIDTTASFRDEFNGYCAELSAPYLRDSLVEKQLINEAYGRMSKERRVAHILVPLGQTVAERQAFKTSLDSVRTAILGGADFAELARKYSIDRSVVNNGGDLGFIRANMFPYPFEEGAYNTAVGEISPVIEDAPYGFHIIKVLDERDAQGDVSARHILKLTQGLSPEEAQAKKAEIDSIAALLAAGADFEELARKESEDPGSAARGGNLGFFGKGMMVPEFEAAAFSLKPGEISAPFATAYGYHIVQTLEYKGLPSLEEAAPTITNFMKRDGRSKLPVSRFLSSVREKSGVNVNEKKLDEVYKIIETASTPAEALSLLSSNNDALAQFPSNNLTVSAVAAKTVVLPGQDFQLAFNDALKEAVDDASLDLARSQLMERNADYRNLVNEYRDGILLFEISNRNVWGRAADDAVAQSDFFTANRDKYTWEKPHYKGYVIFATSDSVATEARGFLAANKVENDSLSTTLRGKFGADIKVERVLTAQGDNAIIDQIAFGGEKADPVGKWTNWFPYGHRVITAPEEVADVKAALVADLQQSLESQWVDSLHKTYKVKINKKALKNL